MKKKTAYLGVMLALALICSYVEVLIPFSIGIPGIKLGLANIVIVFALYSLGTKESYILSIARVLISGFMFGNVIAIAYSLAGGLLSLFVMYLLFVGRDELPVGLDVVKSGPESHNDHSGNCDIGKNVPLCERLEGKNNGLKDYCADANYLKHCLDLSKPACCNYDTLVSAYNKTDGGNCKLTEHYDSCCPDEYGADVIVLIDDGKESAENHELIRKGIHEFSEVCDKIIFSCDLTVQHVGKACDNEDCKSNKTAYCIVCTDIGYGRHHNDHKYGNEKNTQNSELIG